MSVSGVGLSTEVHYNPISLVDDDDVIDDDEYNVADVHNSDYDSEDIYYDNDRMAMTDARGHGEDNGPPNDGNRP
ncbi:hypothetical protein Tco_0714950 [Tanacetum coccineum]